MRDKRNGEEGQEGGSKVIGISSRAESVGCWHTQRLYQESPSRYQEEG